MTIAIIVTTVMSIGMIIEMSIVTNIATITVMITGNSFSSPPLISSSLSLFPSLIYTILVLILAQGPAATIATCVIVTETVTEIETVIVTARGIETVIGIVTEIGTVTEIVIDTTAATVAAAIIILLHHPADIAIISMTSRRTTVTRFMTVSAVDGIVQTHFPSHATFVKGSAGIESIMIAIGTEITTETVIGIATANAKENESGSVSAKESVKKSANASAESRTERKAIETVMN